MLAAQNGSQETGSGRGVWTPDLAIFFPEILRPETFCNPFPYPAFNFFLQLTCKL